MKQKLFINLIFVALVWAAVPSRVFAQQSEAGAAANLATSTVTMDGRISQLGAFLRAYGSPLTSMADHFVTEADRLGLDWKLVAAIAGVESTFGKRIPPGSFNAWGWGVFTGMNDGVHFRDWQDGITVVSEGLMTRYIDRGAITIEQIGAIYAASSRWAGNVRFFMQKIEEFEPASAKFLPITI